MSGKASQIQAQLTAFYQNALKELRSSGCLNAEEQAMLSAPFLLNVEAAEAYFQVRTRVMFVGQETKGWVCRLPQVFENPALIDCLLDRYRKCLLDEPRHSHFLKTRRYLERELANDVPGSVIWNNLFKMDVYRGKRKSRNARNFSEHLTEFSARLFRFEFSLLQPDVVILGCSATHDGIVKSLFEKPMRKTVFVYKPRELWHFTYDETDCFRTLHPAVARFGRQNAVREHYGTIVEAVKMRNSLKTY